MDAEAWQRLRHHLEALLSLEDGARQSYLEDLRRNDNDLAVELAAWLPYADVTDDRFEEPLFDVHYEGELGRLFGPYRAIELLGRGGMGSVFLACRDGSDQTVALKVMAAGLDGDGITGRFQTERRILASLDHPNIARILDGGSDASGRPYFVMEAVRGQPIDVYCELHGLSIEERLRLFSRVCSAVQWAHASLVVHCDLKPSNILITEDGVPKLLDFGIAKVLRPSVFDDATGGRRPVTLQYASPEQLRGEPITTACDIYSLGVLLYILLSGARPYDLGQASHAAAVRAVCEVDPPPPSKKAMARRGQRWSRRLAGDLDSIVLQALAKEPARRYASVEQLAADIERYRGALPVRARPATWRYRSGRFLRRHRWAVLAASAIWVSAVSTTILWFTAQAERDVAIAERQRADAGAEFLVDIFRQTALATRGDPEATGAALQIQVMDRLADRAFTDPLVRADILVSVGTAQLNLGQYERAEELFEGARHVLVGQPDDRSRRRLAKAANNLAGVYFRRGQERRAEKMYRLALVMWSPPDGDEAQVAVADSPSTGEAPINADTAKTWSNLAVLLLRRGALEEAEDILLQVLALRRQRWLDGAPQGARNVSRTWFHLGTLYLRGGRFAESERALQEALRLTAEGADLDRAKVEATLDRLAEARRDAVD